MTSGILQFDHLRAYMAKTQDLDFARHGILDRKSSITAILLSDCFKENKMKKKFLKKIGTTIFGSFWFTYKQR